jgi:hypothetical protein
VMKAADEFKDKTTAPNQLWQTDFTYLTGWRPWHYPSTAAGTRLSGPGPGPQAPGVMPPVAREQSFQAVVNGIRRLDRTLRRPHIGLNDHP